MLSTKSHTASTATTGDETTDILKPTWAAHQSVCKNYCGNVGLDNQEENIDNCTVPKFDQLIQIEYPQCTNSTFDYVVQEYRELFTTSPGKTTAADHYIPTSRVPTRVPPRHIPAHFLLDNSK